jgi:hypothetical protein
MKKFLLFLTCLILFSCEHTDCGCSMPPTLDSKIQIILNDATGKNLIDTDNFKIENLKIYYEKNGQKVPYKRQAYENYKGFEYRKVNEEMKLVILLDESVSFTTTTYIEWNNTQTDKLVAYFYREPNNTSVYRIWLNDVEVWNISKPKGSLYMPTITIIK